MQALSQGEIDRNATTELMCQASCLKDSNCAGFDFWNSYHAEGANLTNMCRIHGKAEECRPHNLVHHDNVAHTHKVKACGKQKFVFFFAFLH